LWATDLYMKRSAENRQFRFGYAQAEFFKFF